MEMRFMFHKKWMGFGYENDTFMQLKSVAQERYVRLGFLSLFIAT